MEKRGQSTVPMYPQKTYVEAGSGMHHAQGKGDTRTAGSHKSPVAEIQETKTKESGLWSTVNWVNHGEVQQASH